MGVVRVEKWGDSYRLVELFRSVDNKSTDKQPKVHARGRAEDVALFEQLTADCGGGVSRFMSSIVRARSRVRELALCSKWDYFATFTLSEEKQDRFDIKSYIKDLGNWIQNYNKKYHCKLQYLIIPEQHKNGAWHAHGLLRGLAPDSLCKNEHGYLDLPYYRNRFGYISLSKVKSHERCASYVTKYISKDVTATAAQLGAGAHLYYSSRGLPGKQVIWQYSGHINGGFRNEYGIYKWTNWDEIQRTIRNDAKTRTKLLSDFRSRPGLSKLPAVKGYSAHSADDTRPKFNGQRPVQSFASVQSPDGIAGAACVRRGRALRVRCTLTENELIQCRRTNLILRRRRYLDKHDNFPEIPGERGKQLTFLGLSIVAQEVDK